MPLAPPSAATPASQAQPTLTPVLTGKERLGGKAADEQRINDCKVPTDERTRPRPGCAAWTNPDAPTN